MTVDLAREATLAKQLLKELKSQGLTWAARGAEFGSWQDKAVALRGWEDRVVALVRRVYGNQSQQERDFNRNITPSIGIYTGEEPTLVQRLQDGHAAILSRLIGHMEALVEDLEMRHCSESGVSGTELAVNHELQELRKFYKELKRYKKNKEESLREILGRKTPEMKQIVIHALGSLPYLASRTEGRIDIFDNALRKDISASGEPLIDYALEALIDNVNKAIGSLESPPVKPPAESGPSKYELSSMLYWWDRFWGSWVVTKAKSIFLITIAWAKAHKLRSVFSFLALILLYGLGTNWDTVVQNFRRVVGWLR